MRTLGGFLHRINESNEWEAIIRDFRRYLDSICYHGIYKYLVTSQGYYFNSAVFSNRNRDFLESLEHFPGGLPRWGLAKCLSARTECVMSDLSDEEMKLASSLERLGIVKIKEDVIVAPGELQLLSVRERYIFIDAAIHFPLDRVHEIYIGCDTLLLSYYLSESHRSSVLDICSGSGIIGLSAGGKRLSDKTTVTDVSQAALSLIYLNAVLNGEENELNILNEDIRLTLASDETFDLITCNPPFVIFPDTLKGPLYAEGQGRDGLGYLRLLLERVPAKLTPEGEGLFVADMPGDWIQPYFFTELQKIADSCKISIDAYVDGRTPADLQIASFCRFAKRMYPDKTDEYIRSEFTRQVRDELGVLCYYLTIVRVRKSGVPGLRIFNRYGAKNFDNYFSKRRH